MNMNVRRGVPALLVAAAAMIGFTGAAAAYPALVTADLNMRRGPGTGYGVITTIPGGSTVDVGGCTGSWCEVDWRGVSGWASASYLDRAGPSAVYVAPPPVVYRAPAYTYYGSPYYGGPRYYRGPAYYGRPGYRGPPPRYRRGLSRGSQRTINRAQRQHVPPTAGGRGPQPGAGRIIDRTTR